MEDPSGSYRTHTFDDGLVIAQIRDDTRVRPGQIGQPVFVGVRPHEDPHIGTSLHLVTDHVRAEEPGAAGDEDGRHAKYR